MLLNLYLLLAFLGSPSYAASSGCDGKIASLASTVADYEYQAGHSKNTLSDVAYKKISETLFSETDPDCEYKLLLSYALKSINVNAYATSDEVRDFYQKKNYVFSQPNVHRKLTQIVIALGHQHKIQFLTHEYRKKQGGRWMTTDENNNFSLMGAYDCESSTIYIDPYLRPLDLAVTLYHELDHMVRDKLTPALEGYLEKNGSIDWNLYNFTDELSAIGYSAGLQLDLQDVPKTYFSSSPFEVSNDFTVFSKQGPFQTFVNSELEHHQSSINAQSPSQLIANLIDHPITFPKEAENTSKIFSTVWQSYFSNIQMADGLLANFSIPKSFITLNSWLNSEFDPNALVALITSPSRSCKLYRDYLDENAREGIIDHYLGSQLVTGDSGSSDFKPSIRPCLRTYGL